jgi:ParB family transcriptional regulator, chromosome partitioning protein
VISRLAARAVERGLSVRELEGLARGGRAPDRRPRKTNAPRRTDPGTRRVEQALRDRLGTDVYVEARGKDAGRLLINFYSSDDLARVLELILGHSFDG